GQRAVVGLGVALVRPGRELDRPPRPREPRIAGEVPRELLGRLDAETAGRRVEEASPALLLDRVHRPAFLLADLPAGRELADLALGEILDRRAVLAPHRRGGDGELGEDDDEGAQGPAARARPGRPRPARRRDRPRPPHPRTR